MSAPEAIDGTYDPFEEFNRSVGAGVVENPYPLLAMARAKGPMLKENLEAELLAAEVDPQVTMGPEVFTAFVSILGRSSRGSHPLFPDAIVRVG